MVAADREVVEEVVEAVMVVYLDREVVEEAVEAELRNVVVGLP